MRESSPFFFMCVDFSRSIGSGRRKKKDQDQQKQPTNIKRKRNTVKERRQSKKKYKFMHGQISSLSKKLPSIIFGGVDNAGSNFLIWSTMKLYSVWYIYTCIIADCYYFTCNNYTRNELNYAAKQICIRIIDICVGIQVE
jgi:hypothetical protein